MHEYNLKSCEGMSTVVPNSAYRINRAIEALEWQLEQDIPQKDREILSETLDAYRSKIFEIETPETPCKH